jgi:phospholipid/cholesterol/gamma-HCH transport system substrate-binding protein
MNIFRNEVRTGLLVVLTMGALVAVLLYLGAPGVFTSQNTFYIFVDNAVGIQEGAKVLVAGRDIGQVRRIFSPVPESERWDWTWETKIEVNVGSSARIYKDAKVTLTQNGLLGEMLIDFSSGTEASGLAPHGYTFVAVRPAGLSEAVPKVLEAINPALKKITETLDSLQDTSDNLTELTGPNGDLTKAILEYKAFGSNLKDLTGQESSLRKTLTNLETLTGDGGRVDKAVANVQNLTDAESDLAKTLKNAEEFTAKLNNSKDIEGTLSNLRQTSEKLNSTMSELGPQFSNIGENLEQASDTVKRQPWRLIWPSTKKYKDEPAVASTPAPRKKAVQKRPSKSSRSSTR